MARLKWCFDLRLQENKRRVREIAICKTQTFTVIMFSEEPISSVSLICFKDNGTKIL